MRSYLWVIFERLFNALCLFLAIVYAARMVGPVEFGQLSVAFVLFSMGAVISQVGLTRVILSRVSGSNRPLFTSVFYGRASLKVRVATSVVVFLGLVAVSYVLFERDLGIIIRILAVALLFEAGQSFGDSMQGRGDKFLAVLPSVISSSFGVGLKVGFITLGFGPVGFAVAHLSQRFLFFVLSLIGFLVFLRDGRNGIGGFKASLLLPKGIPILLTNLLHVFYQKVDLVVVSAVSSDKVAGLYAAPQKIYEGFFLLYSSVGIALYPKLVALYKSDIDAYYLFYKKCNYIGLLGMAIFSLFFMLFSREVMAFVFGGGYEDSATVLMLFCVPLMLMSVSFLRAGHLNLVGGNVYLLFTTFTGALLSVLLNLILVPSIGLLGAAFTVITVQAVSLLLIDLMLVKHRRHFLRSLI